MKLWLWPEPLPGVWCQFEHQVAVKYLGEAKPGMARGVVCASFCSG